MEHRNNWQHHVHGREPRDIRKVRGETVQHCRAVAEEYPFRVAGGPGGVTKARRREFIQLRPLVPRVTRTQQIIVADDAGKRICRTAGLRLQQNDMGNRLQPVPDRGHQRHECLIDKEHLVLSVVDDIDKLFGKEARIDRVADKAAARDPEIDFKVAAVIPGDRRAARLRLKTQPGQRRGQQQSVVADRSPVCNFHPAASIYRGDLRLTVVTGCVLHERRDQQRFGHHLTTHSDPPFSG